MRGSVLIFLIAFTVSGCATTRFDQPTAQAKPMIVKAKPAGAAPVSIAPQPAPVPAPKVKPKKKKRWWAPWR